MGNFRLRFGALLRRLVIVALSLGGVLGATIGRIEATEVISVEIGKACLFNFPLRRKWSCWGILILPMW